MSNEHEQRPAHKKGTHQNRNRNEEAEGEPPKIHNGKGTQNEHYNKNFKNAQTANTTTKQQKHN